MQKKYCIFTKYVKRDAFIRKVETDKEERLLVFQIQVIKEGAFFQCLPALLKTHILYCLKYMLHHFCKKDYLKFLLTHPVLINSCTGTPSVSASV